MSLAGLWTIDPIGGDSQESLQVFYKPTLFTVFEVNKWDLERV